MDTFSLQSKDEPWIAYDKSLHPTHRIFFSIDVINSTYLKTAFAQANLPKVWWARCLLNFFSQAQIAFIDAIESKLKSCPSKCCGDNIDGESKNCRHLNHPQNHGFLVWKHLGDEILFVGEMHCGRHPALFVEAARDTLKKLNESFKKIFVTNSDITNSTKKNKGIIAERTGIEGIEFKGTLWIAGFPTTNIELLIYDRLQKYCINDFFGTSIDLGFRLSKLSTKSRLVLHSSLVYLILHDTPEDILLPPMFAAGHVSLKGVLRGKHALFWTIPDEDEQSAQEEKSLALSVNEKKEEVLEYFEKLYAKTKRTPPFIREAGGYDSNYCEEYLREGNSLADIPGTVFYQLHAGETLSFSKVWDLLKRLTAIAEKNPPKAYSQGQLSEIINEICEYVAKITSQDNDVDHNYVKFDKDETMKSIEERIGKH